VVEMPMQSSESFVSFQNSKMPPMITYTYSDEGVRYRRDVVFSLIVHAHCFQLSSPPANQESKTDLNNYGDLRF